MRFFSRPIPAETRIEIDGVPVRVAVRVNARARRYRLTLSHSGEAVLTVPAGGRWGEAESFLVRHRPWLAARLKRGPEPLRMAEGAHVPVRGEPHRIALTGRLRGRVETETGPDGPVIMVPGEPVHLPRRLTDWFRAEALGDLERASAIHAGRLGVKVRAVRVRGQSTRWGSCSSTGSLSYNWRLVAAPPAVLDYVAAHEVAHLVEMNHSPAFWAAVARTLPDYERPKSWLRAHGPGLMTLGR